MSLLGFFSDAASLKPGSAAPRVTGRDQDGNEVNLGAACSQGLTLVYFYPKADTPGCTAQACSLRDDFAGLTGKGLKIFGVSGDNPEGQRKFRAKYGLPFTLLADADGKIAAAFHVPSLLGFAKRQSFLIKDGTIVWTALSAGTAKHAEEVQAAIEKFA